MLSEVASAKRWKTGDFNICAIIYILFKYSLTILINVRL